MSEIWTIERHVILHNGARASIVLQARDAEPVIKELAESARNEVATWLECPVRVPDGSVIQLGQVLMNLGIRGFDHVCGKTVLLASNLAAPPPRRIIIPH